VAFDQSGPRWLGISDLIAEPEGPTFISYKVARSRLNRLRFVTQDPLRMARSILERHSGRLECREPASTSGLGFYAIQNIATIQASSGIIRGIPDNGP